MQAYRKLTKDAPDQQRAVEELIRRHPHTLQLQKTDAIHEQTWISMNLVRDFARETERFFERIFRSAGLPNRHLQMDSRPSAQFGSTTTT